MASVTCKIKGYRPAAEKLATEIAQLIGYAGEVNTYRFGNALQLEECRLGRDASRIEQRKAQAA